MVKPATLVTCSGLFNGCKTIRGGERLRPVSNSVGNRLLIRALSDPQTATRLAATQTLGQMGWVATSASPVLVAVAQGDPDLELRRGAVQALSQIARRGQAQAEQWQGWQVGEINHLKDLQQGLDQLLPALEQDQTSWPTKAEDLAALGLASRGLQPVVEDLTQTPTYPMCWMPG